MKQEEQRTDNQGLKPSEVGKFAAANLIESGACWLSRAGSRLSLGWETLRLQWSEALRGVIAAIYEDFIGFDTID
jgi:hypothetical protein